ncbi:hypothetical protein [Streptomyces sirii]|uniref:hypothetical protein n=1 Tax=Streptomyces sirii TaxID=3127701 RepID=UPI003D369EBC
MTAHTDHPADPARHPELLAWLDERRRAFPSWAENTGHAGRLDFAPASLGVLDHLVRQTAGSSEQITTDRLTPFIQGAVWYVGEVFCHHKGMVWKYQADADYGYAPLFARENRTSILDTPCVGLPDDEPDRGLYPLNMLRRLLIDEDEMGMPVDATLPSIFEAPYDDEDGEGEEDEEEA